MITPDNHILVSAIQSINPDAKFSLSSIDDIRWHDGTDPISKESIEAEIKKITPTINAIENRKEAYPEITEQLDLLYHDMTAGKGDKTGEWYKAVNKVKTDNPKPE